MLTQMKMNKLAKHIFQKQRSGAKARGIGFDLTLEEWWSIWGNSKRWKQRGRGVGKYCMGRFGDVGPYAVGNVKIIKFTDNSGDSTRGKHVNCKPVVQFLGKLPIAEFSSAIQAEHLTGIVRSSICQVCKGDRRSAGGYRWRYKND